ncbi:hypothetical protein [Streptomyces sp. NPDC004330]|uniref:hypothetical protein n=1 Tax=unclassified Streptomyces TaxID=2593676 RepID=UPI0036CD7B6C
MDHILGVGDTPGDGRLDLEAADGSWLHRYQGLAGGGLRKVTSSNASWWALGGAAAF